MDPEPDLQNSKWRIQYGEQIFKKLMSFHETWHLEDLGACDNESEVRFKKIQNCGFNIVDKF